MNITLEQARALDALVKHGTFQKAAEHLNKGHSAVMYLIKSLETETGLSLFDRSGYKNKITQNGEIVLNYCKQLLATQEELSQVCKILIDGWEPKLKLVYDGVIDFNMIGDTLFKLSKSHAPTEIQVFTAHLQEVESTFTKEHADLMLTILPMQKFNLPFVQLQSLKMFLVAHRDHPLCQSKGSKKITASQLTKYPIIKVYGSGVQLGLSTDGLQISNHFFVNDFSAKKQAILKQLGFGWLPEYIVKNELRSQRLKLIPTSFDNQHIFQISLYHRHSDTMGKMASKFIEVISHSYQ